MMRLTGSMRSRISRSARPSAESRLVRSLPEKLTRLSLHSSSNSCSPLVSSSARMRSKSEKAPSGSAVRFGFGHASRNPSSVRRNASRWSARVRLRGRLVPDQLLRRRRECGIEPFQLHGTGRRFLPSGRRESVVEIGALGVGELALRLCRLVDALLRPSTSSAIAAQRCAMRSCSAWVGRCAPAATGAFLSSPHGSGAAGPAPSDRPLSPILLPRPTDPCSPLTATTSILSTRSSRIRLYAVEA